jgi:dCMP deaminase
MPKIFSKMKKSNKWETRFLEMARLVSGWSKDPSTKVGAVIVRPDKTIASVGYNGIARGVKDTETRLGNRDQKLLYTVHAEQNAILSAKEPLNGYSLYVWNIHPCAQCAASIIQTGIKNIYLPSNTDIISTKTITRWIESFKAAEIMFREAKVKLNYIK